MLQCFPFARAAGTKMIYDIWGFGVQLFAGFVFAIKNTKDVFIFTNSARFTNFASNCGQKFGKRLLVLFAVLQAAQEVNFDNVICIGYQSGLVNTASNLISIGSNSSG